MPKPRLPKEIEAQAEAVWRDYQAGKIFPRRMIRNRDIVVFDLRGHYRLVHNTATGRREVMSHQRYNRFGKVEFA